MILIGVVFPLLWVGSKKLCFAMGCSVKVAKRYFAATCMRKQVYRQKRPSVEDICDMPSF